MYRERDIHTHISYCLIYDMWYIVPKTKARCPRRRRRRGSAPCRKRPQPSLMETGWSP